MTATDDLIERLRDIDKWGHKSTHFSGPTLSQAAAELTRLRARVAQRDQQIAVYNSGGFADADALAERFITLIDERNRISQLHADAMRLVNRAEARVKELEAEPEGLQGWGLLLKAPITHGHACAWVTNPDGTEWRAEDSDCTCGYEWRVRLATSMTLHNAWRKRAIEAEAERDELQREHIRCLDKATDYMRERDEFQRLLGKATSERDALKADAERYRWLRDNRVGYAMHMGAVLYMPELVVPRGMEPPAIDAAIDAARKEGK